MTRKIEEPTTQRTSQEVRRAVLRWVTKGDEIVRYKKIEVADVFLDKPLPGADDRDITSKLRAQLPHVPQQATREAFANGQQTGGIWWPLALGVVAGSILMASIRIVTWVAA